MTRRTAKELREMFVSFWEEKGSKHLPSFSLVPEDPSLLFTIAGMVPLKPYYLGIKNPEYPRVVTSQKCVRTNDIENVGRTISRGGATSRTRPSLGRGSSSPSESDSTLNDSTRQSTSTMKRPSVHGVSSCQRARYTVADRTKIIGSWETQDLADLAAKSTTTEAKSILAESLRAVWAVIVIDTWKSGISCLPSSTGRKMAASHYCLTRILIQAWG